MSRFLVPVLLWLTGQIRRNLRNWVNKEMSAVLAGLHAVFAELDARLPVGQPPGTADEILQVISFAALAHGECLRVHPFANGNGRIARLLVAFICMRYTVPMFLHIKPRPEGEDYVRASRDSMGRPPTLVAITRPRLPSSRTCLPTNSPAASGWLSCDCRYSLDLARWRRKATSAGRTM